MGLKAIVPTLDDVPQQFRELYTERNGQFELTGVEGMRTQADVDRISVSLNKEREDHRATKSRLVAFGDLEPEAVRTQLAKIPELEILARSTKLNPAEIEGVVAARVKQVVEPLQLQLKTTATELEAARGEIGTYKVKDRANTIGSAVRTAATGAKVIEHALDDIMLNAERVFDVQDGRVVTKADIPGVPAGIEPSVWLSTMQARRPHWWGPSIGGGAGGSGGGAGVNNPFSAAHWNMTEQSRMASSDMAKAEQMAAAAGTTVGGPMPKK